MVNSNIGFNIERVGGAKYATSSRESTLNLVKTNPMHLTGETDNAQNATDTTVNGLSFSDMLIGSLDKVNNLESTAAQLNTQFIIDPESVNEHDVTIASTEATLALNITTTIINKAVEAYKSIMSLG